MKGDEAFSVAFIPTQVLIILFFSPSSPSRQLHRSAGLLAADCAARRDENARTIKPNDPLFQPRIIPGLVRLAAKSYGKRKLTRAHLRIHFIRGKERLFRTFCHPPHSRHPHRANPLGEPSRHPRLAGISDTEALCVFAAFYRARVNEFYIRSVCSG